MPDMSALRTYRAAIFCKGKEMHGELDVSGFADVRTANEVGKLFADAIAEHYGPAVEVEVQIKMDRAYLRSVSE